MTEILVGKWGFKAEILKNINPDEVVALGAAIMVRT